MTIRLPRLLDDHLHEVTRLHPLQLSLHLTLAPLSTAEMRLPHEAPALFVRDLVELYDEQGSVGIFRVTAVQGSWAASAAFRWSTASPPCGTR